MRRLFVSVGAAAMLSRADSEALASTGSHPFLRPEGATATATAAGAAIGKPYTAARRWLPTRSHGVATKGSTLSVLRGGGLSWNTPETAAAGRKGRGAEVNSNSNGGGSNNGGDMLGMFSNAVSAWGGGNSKNINNDGDNRKRVETKGPPDLAQQRPPATAPGSSLNDGDYARYSSPSRDRVKTVGPPDVSAREIREHGRNGRGKGAGVGRFFAGAAQRNPGDPVAGWTGQGANTGGSSASYYADTGASGRIAMPGNGRNDGEGSAPRRTDGAGNHRGLMAVHYLILTCFGLFSLNTIMGVDGLLGLSLSHSEPKWWQLATSVLLHGDQHHLMGNMFNLLIFGKMAEEDMGALGMLFCFLMCGLVSSIVSILSMPRATYSCGASGAIFGLYSICVLGKLFNTGVHAHSEGGLRKLVEAAVFGWFVVESVRSEVRMLAGGGVAGIDHAAHFGGVLAGAAVILIMRKSIRDGKIRDAREF